MSIIMYKIFLMVYVFCFILLYIKIGCLINVYILYDMMIWLINIFLKIV